MIDWKTSVRPKPSLEDCYDFPLQAAAYAGAINQDPQYPFKVVFPIYESIKSSAITCATLTTYMHELVMTSSCNIDAKPNSKSVVS